MSNTPTDLPLPLPAEATGTAPGRGRMASRRILIVGGGQRPNDDPDTPIGNGRATAMLAAREGARVACADIDGESAAETVAGIQADGGTGIAIQADAGDETDVERMVREAADGLGGLDGLVLNVGIGTSGHWLSGTSSDEWDLAMGVNVRAHFLACKHALDVLEPGGSIVFVSSIAGITPGSRMPAYDASKAALGGLCRHVAFEGARKGVRANVVYLGLIDTPLGRLATRGRPSRTAAPVPLKRQATGWETAYTVLFLLSNEASYITGQQIVMDGGLTALH